MRTRMYRIFAVGVTVLGLVGSAHADSPEKEVHKDRQADLASAGKRFIVLPGETVRWQSRTLPAEISQLSIRVNGRQMLYELVPRTRACVAYAYGQGVAVRLTDCRLGRRVFYLRLRATNIGVRPKAVRIQIFATD